MEILFRQLVIGVVPLPVGMPAVTPFSAEVLQRAYMDVSREHPYAQFQFLPGGAGAQFLNSPDDAIMIQPGVIQVRHLVSSTAEVARERVTSIIRTLVNRLGIGPVAAVGIKVIAHVPISGSARVFVGEQLMKGADQADELGPDFFPGGVKYLSLGAAEAIGSGHPVQTLLIEPFIQDDTFIYVDYDIQRQQPSGALDPLPGWLDEAFAFVRGPALELLERGT